MLSGSHVGNDVKLIIGAPHSVFFIVIILKRLAIFP